MDSLSIARAVKSGSEDDAVCPVGDRSRPALLYSLPIGLLGGLIGLGGAEFRLPVLAGPLRYRARQAVALNLAVTLVTVAAALGTRGTTLSLGALATVIPALSGLLAGSLIGAAVGPAGAGRLSDRHFDRVIFALLVGLGCGLVLDGFLSNEPVGPIDRTGSAQLAAGLVLGLPIGLVSSLLGVAGGKLLIPTPSSEHVT